MGSIYQRGGMLYASFKDGEGKWRNRSLGLTVGDEKKARALLREIELQARAGAEVGLLGEVTVARYADHWIKRRREGGLVADASNEAARLTRHFVPVLGKMVLADVRPRHLIRWVQDLRGAGKLAPRSILSCYGVVRLMFKDAVREELLRETPCKLDKRDLPAMTDKDPEWRPTAIYTRDELVRLISDPLVPPDRHVLYALEGLAALRHGEAAGLRWRHIDTAREGLGAIRVATSYDSGRTKTERPREMPIHPVLAEMLASWRSIGWPAMFGREPSADDLVVPLEPDPARKRARANPRGGGMRAKNDSFKRLKTDLARLGLRHRRGHDLRRTMISLARSAGADKYVLELCTHNPGTRDTIDLYTTFDWPTRCAEIAKLKIERPSPPSGATALAQGAVEPEPARATAAGGAAAPMWQTGVASSAVPPERAAGAAARSFASSAAGGLSAHQASARAPSTLSASAGLLGALHAAGPAAGRRRRGDAAADAPAAPPVTDERASAVSAPLSAVGGVEAVAASNVLQIDEWRRRESKDGAEGKGAVVREGGGNGSGALEHATESADVTSRAWCRNCRKLGQPLADDAIAGALEQALGHWQTHRDPVELARVLSRVVVRLLGE